MKIYLRSALLVFCLILLVGQFSLVQADSGDYIVQGERPINARACPQLNCAVVTTYAPGDVIEVLETVEGDAVSGNTQWHHLRFEDADVYVHSSLVAPASSDLADAQDAVSTTNWVRYQGMGMSIEVPSDWENLSGDESYIRYLIANSSSEASTDVLYASLSTSLFFMEPDTPLWISVTQQSYGSDYPLAMLRMDVVNYLREQSYGFIETSVEDLPFGKALRSHYARQEKGSSRLSEETIEYQFYQDRVMFDLVIYSEREMKSETVQLFDAVVKTFEVSDPPSIRRALAAAAGDATKGQNSATIKLGQNHFWFYEGDESEVITVNLVSADPALEKTFARLVVRAPSGEVIAEAADNLSNGAPRIVQLELPEGGRYEIEVYIFGEYKVAEYKLIIVSGAKWLTTNEM